MTLPGDGEICGQEEVLARGITSFHLYNGVITEKLFKGKEVSVNRLLKMNLEESIVCFKKDLPRPQENLTYWGHALLKVAQLLDSAQKHKQTAKGFNADIAAVYRPLENNLGHSQLEPNIPTGFAKRFTEETKQRGDIFPDNPTAAWS